MNNKEIQKKVLKKAVAFKTWSTPIQENVKILIEEIIAEKDAQHDDFVKSLKGGIEAEMKVAEKFDTENAKQSLMIYRMILTGINLKNKEDEE